MLIDKYVCVRIKPWGVLPLVWPGWYSLPRYCHLLKSEKGTRLTQRFLNPEVLTGSVRFVLAQYMTELVRELVNELGERAVHNGKSDWKRIIA